MKKLGGESGQTLVLVALSMAVLLGFAAFATDVGVMLREKRMVQSAADSAAMASAWALSNGTDPDAAGKAAATSNGFTNGTDASGYATTVVIHSTPVDGSFAGQAGYTEAVITRQMPTFFMHVFGKDLATVSARAVATDKGTADGCIHMLKTTGTTAQFQGSFHVSAPKCSVIVDSSDPDALHFTGGAGSLIAGAVSVVGGDGGQTGDSSPAPTTGVNYTGDPLAGKLTTPSFDLSDTSTCPVTTSIGTTGTQTEITNTPTGVVCFANPTGDIQLTNVTLDAGTYVFANPNGSLVLSGNITGDGVTIYLLGGMNELSGTTLDLSAPGADGAYPGILLWAAPSDAPASDAKLCPTGTANAGPGIIQLNLGNSSGSFKGEIYAPNASMVFQDSGSDSSGPDEFGDPDLVTDIIVGTMCDETADLNITSYAQTVNNYWFPKITLVE